MQALPATVRTGLCVGPGRLEGDAAFLADGNARGDWIAVVEDRAGPVIASEPEPGNILVPLPPNQRAQRAVTIAVQRDR